MPTIAYTDPNSGQAKSFEIQETNSSISLGRNQGNDIRIENSSISRQHARLEVMNGLVTLIDLGSSNGSFVNGSKVTKINLHDGDVIKLGEVELVFRDPTKISSAAAIEAEYGDQTSLGLADYPSANFYLPKKSAATPHPSAIDSAWSSSNVSPITPSGFPDTPPSSNPAALRATLAKAPAAISAPLGGGPSSVGSVSGPPPKRVPLGPAGYNASLNNSSASMRSPRFGGYQIDTGATDLGEVTKFEPNPGDPPAASNSLKISSHGRLNSIPPIPSAASSVSVNGGGAYSNDPNSEIDALRRERDALLDIVEGRADEVAHSMSAQLRRMRNERDKLIFERRNINKQIAEIQEKLENSSYERLQQEFDRVRVETEQLRSQVDEYKGKLQTYHGRVEEFKSKADDFEKKLKEVERENKQLIEDQEKAQALAPPETDPSEYFKTLKASFEKEKEKNVELTASLEEKTREFDEQAEELARAKQELDELREKLEKEEDSAVDTVEDESKEVSEVEETSEEPSEQDVLAGQNEKLQRQIDDLIATNEELKRTLEARPNHLEFQELADELKQTRAGLSSTRDERDSLTVERDQLLQKVDEMELVSAEKEQLYGEQVAQLEIVTAERDALKQEKSAFARETDYLQVEKKRLQDESQKLRDQLKAATKDDRKKKRIFEELSNDLRNLVTLNQQLTAEINALKQRSSMTAGGSQQAEVDALNEQNRLLKDHNQSLSGEIMSLRQELNLVGQERDTLCSQIDGLEAVVEQLQSNAKSNDESLHHELVELRQKSREDADQLLKLHEELDSLKARLEDTTGELIYKNKELERREEKINDLQKIVEEHAPDSFSTIEDLKEKLQEAERKLFEVIIEKDRLEDELRRQSPEE